ncbi:MAG: PD40 domain-containing protein, partial [Deltaproteobacteria bacterium]|nr:PD40 domain-containing protein [Deltaproteobacteria bacterium]
MTRRLLLACACSTAACSTTLPPTRSPELDRGAHGVFVAPTPVVASPDDEIEPSVAAAGDDVVYAARVAGNLDLYRRSLHGGSAVRLTVHPTDDTSPTFSPDGGRIV